jgi:hypothetical protein
VDRPPDPELPARVPRRWAGPATDTGPPPPEPKRSHRPDPAWNKLLLIVGVAVAAVALLVVPGILNRGGQNPIAAAAEATSDSPGVRMSFTVTAQGPEQLTMNGTGLLNGETNRASMQLSASGATAGQTGPVSLEEVIDDGDLYISSPELGGQLGALGGSKHWLLVKAEVFGGLLQGGSGGLGAGMSANPAQQLDALEDASDQVTEVGHERIDRVDTTHYTAVIDVGKLADALKSRTSGDFGDLIDKSLEQLSSQTVDVWIDGQGLVRREASSASMGTLGSIAMTMDFSDYGIHPNIAVPPSSEVYDVTPMLQGALDQLSNS